MQTIQLVLSDARFAEKLKLLLDANGNWSVQIQSAPDFSRGGVVVLDDITVQTVSGRPDNPERVVVITAPQPELLSQVWDLGIRSVVSHTDQPNTILLAIMAAFLRLPRSSQSPDRRIRPSAGRTQLLNIDY